jgi:hypothetical protein
LDLRSPRLIKIQRKKECQCFMGPSGFEISEADKNKKEKECQCFMGGLSDLRSPRLLKIRRKKSASVLWGAFRI